MKAGIDDGNFVSHEIGKSLWERIAVVDTLAERKRVEKESYCLADRARLGFAEPMFVDSIGHVKNHIAARPFDLPREHA